MQVEPELILVQSKCSPLFIESLSPFSFELLPSIEFTKNSNLLLSAEKCRDNPLSFGCSNALTQYCSKTLEHSSLADVTIEWFSLKAFMNISHESLQ